MGLADPTGAEPREGADGSGRRKQERNFPNAGVHGDPSKNEPGDRRSEAEISGTEDQAKIPVQTFALQTTPTRVVAIDQYRPMPKTIVVPLGLFCGDERVYVMRVPRRSKQGKVPGNPPIVHVIQQYFWPNAGQSAQLDPSFFSRAHIHALLFDRRRDGLLVVQCRKHFGHPAAKDGKRVGVEPGVSGQPMPVAWTWMWQHDQ